MRYRFRLRLPGRVDSVDPGLAYAPYSLPLRYAKLGYLNGNSRPTCPRVALGGVVGATAYMYAIATI